MNHRTIFGTGLALVALLLGALTTTVSAQDVDEPAFCRGREVTVFTGSGDFPTPGDDVILGTDGDDVIDARGGDDVVCGLGGDDQLIGSSGNDVLVGGPGKDRLRAGAGADRLFGGRGHDLLLGGGGRDLLAGGRGIDRLIGGAQKDRCNDSRRVRQVKSCEAGSVLPGLGQTAVMARANWSSGYIQAEIMHQVSEELGYEVNHPRDLELPPDINYDRMAEGQIDFWTNSWYPAHYIWWEGDRADATRIGDYLTKFDAYVQAPEGILIDKASAEQYDINSFEDVANSPALLAALDRDGNGVAEIRGCPTNWTCDDHLEHILDDKGWNGEVFEQLSYGYDSMFAESLDFVRGGEPVLYYTWGPSLYFSVLTPGEDVLWLGFEEPPSPIEVIPDLEPEHIELPGPSDHCVIDPCFTGFGGFELTITANSAFAEQNPAMARLFEAARIPTKDISDLQREQADSRGGEIAIELAQEWISENRRLVDQWLNAARTTP